MTRRAHNITSLWRFISSRLVFGILAVMSSIIVSSAGVAAAQSDNGNSNDQGTPSIVSMCKHDFEQLGYKNVGDCVSHNNGHGHGYGGSDTDHDHDKNIFNFISSIIQQLENFLKNFKF